MQCFFCGHLLACLVEFIVIVMLVLSIRILSSDRITLAISCPPSSVGFVAEIFHSLCTRSICMQNIVLHYAGEVARCLMPTKLRTLTSFPYSVAATMTVALLPVLDGAIMTCPLDAMTLPVTNWRATRAGVMLISCQCRGLVEGNCRQRILAQ